VLGALSLVSIVLAALLVIALIGVMQTRGVIQPRETAAAASAQH
jgi:hypothetical protein